MLRHHFLHISGFLTLFTLTLVLSFFAANYVEQSETAQALVEHFGYAGILIISIIAGFNIVVPIPAATFTPIYEAAGFSLPLIIVTLTAGTLIADVACYLIGVGGRHLATRNRYGKIQGRLERFARNNTRYVPHLTFLWSALMPLPNEVLLIPFGLLGIPFRSLLVPLILGNLFYQTLFTYGTTSLFGLLF